MVENGFSFFSFLLFLNKRQNHLKQQNKNVFIHVKKTLN